MLYPMFLDNKEEGIWKWVHYFPIYERFFKDFVNKSVLMIEIGVYKGGSLQMWKKYLGPYATVVGIDIDPEAKLYEDEQCRIRIGDQGDPKFLGSVIKEFGRPDIVLDDGSHMQSDMDKSFQFLYPLLNNNGVYMVEDTHCCYLPRQGGGLRKKESFIEKAKDLIDYLNGYFVEEENMVNDFTKSTFSVSFFDSIVAFEKRVRTQRPYALRKGKF